MARGTNAMITYEDANFMILNEGFSLLGAYFEGYKVLSKENILDYMNADADLITSYADNQLVPYQKLVPSTNGCCPPTFDSITESGSNLLINWTLPTGCANTNAITVAYSIDLVNWSTNTSSPVSPRSVTKPTILTYYRLRSECNDGPSDWSDVKSWEPAGTTPSPITVLMTKVSGLESHFKVSGGTATQNISVEFQLTGKTTNPNSFISVNGFRYMYNSNDKVIISETLPVGSTGLTFVMLFEGYAQGDGAAATAELIAATVDGVPPESARWTDFDAPAVGNTLVLGQLLGSSTSNKYFTVDNFSVENTIQVNYTLTAVSLLNGSVKVEGESLALNVPSSTFTVLAGTALWSQLVYIDTGGENGAGSTATVSCKLISADKDFVPSPSTEVMSLSIVADTTPPSVPQNLSGTNNGSSISLDWDDSTDNVGGSGMSHYELWKSYGWDAGNISANPVTAFYKTMVSSQYTDTELAFEGIGSRWINYQVIAVDNAGNKSAKSSKIRVYE